MKNLMLPALALAMTLPVPAIGTMGGSAAQARHHDRHHARHYQSGRVYRGRDGRYYCRRSDGTTGTIIGGVGGGVVGNVVTHGSLLGTVVGAGAGALVGRHIDKKTVHCG